MAGSAVDEVALDRVRSHMQDVRVPSHHDKARKICCAVKTLSASITAMEWQKQSMQMLAARGIDAPVRGALQHLQEVIDLTKACLRQRTASYSSRECHCMHAAQVYKEECAFSFATPLAPSGLFLNMKTWQSYSEQFLELDRSRTGNALYLWEKWHKVCSCKPHVGTSVSCAQI